MTHYAAGHSVTNRHLRLLTRNRVVAHTGRREFTNDDARVDDDRPRRRLACAQRPFHQEVSHRIAVSFSSVSQSSFEKRLTSGSVEFPNPNLEF